MNQEHPIDKLHRQRGEVYGDFADIAEKTQIMKRILIDDHKMSAVQAEALSMILTKIARISAGDPSYIDNWRDIAGYANLAVKDINRQATNVRREAQYGWEIGQQTDD